MQQAIVRPRFRQDLVAEPIDDGGARFIDVMDPDSGNVFRFYEVEYSLACAMDGERDVAGIAQWAKEELGLAPSPKEITSVIATLGDLGYLDRGAPAVTAPRAPETAAAAVLATFDHEATATSAPPHHHDDELARGIVADARRPAAAVSDVELGRAGTATVRGHDLPAAPELELGAPGATGPRGREPARAEDIALGVSGRSDTAADEQQTVRDVSVDLSDHLAVRPDDVKEAVRASQVMRAVDVPKELLDSVEPVLENAPAVAGKPAAAQRPAAEPRPEARPPERGSVEAKPKPAVELPKQPPYAAPPTAAPVAPIAPRSGPSPLLLAVLLVVIVGAAVFIVYKFVLKKSDDSATSSVPPTEPAVTQPPAPEPVAPAVETQKLANEQPGSEDIKPSTAGQLEMIIGNDSEVKAGDVVAWLAGHKPVETEVTSLQQDIDKRIKPDLDKATKERDAAQAAGNKSGLTSAEARVADRQKSLDDKQGKLAAKKAELDKYQIKASSAGKVKVIAKANAHVTPNDVVAQLVRAPVLVATFKSATAPLGAHVLVTTKAGQKLTCVVAAVSDAGVKVSCPHDAATESSDVTFGGIDPSSPPAEIEMGDEGSGSAAAPSPHGTQPPAAPKPHAPASDKPANPVDHDKPAAGSETAPAPAPADNQPASP